MTCWSPVPTAPTAFATCLPSVNEGLGKDNRKQSTALLADCAACAAVPLCSATAKLLGAALGGDSSDIEMASGSIGTGFVPSWLARSEKIKSDMTQLKGRINKLKE